MRAMRARPMQRGLRGVFADSQIRRERVSLEMSCREGCRRAWMSVVRIGRVPLYVDSFRNESAAHLS